MKSKLVLMFLMLNSSVLLSAESENQYMAKKEDIKLHSLDYIKSRHLNMDLKVENKIAEALDILDKESRFLYQFSEENLESLYKIEMINPAYFPGLSGATAATILNLHIANPSLKISLLIEISDNLARRRRPWESLNAFSRIATSCPQQMTEEMLFYLSKVNSDILEICSHDVKRQSEKGILLGEPSVKKIVEETIRWAQRK